MASDAATVSSDTIEQPALLGDLERAMKRFMLRELPIDRSCTLRELDVRGLQSIYATWRGRVPVVMPRRVHISDELMRNEDRQEYADGLAAVVREIAFGEDLRPRLSTAIEHAYELKPPPYLAPRLSGQQHDRLLADWGIHHLHLSTKSHHRRPEFLARTRQVLFVAFVGLDAYLIDLRPHESAGANWSELAILEIVVRNWPDAGILLSSVWATGLSGGNWSDADRRRLREHGVATGMVEIDGRVWSAGGQSLAGQPLKVGQHCMRTSWFLSGYEPSEDQLLGELGGMAEKHGVPDDWRALMDGDEYGFFSDGLFVKYGSLLP